MSTVIGHRMVEGGSVKYHSTGQGVARNIASSVVGTVGNALVSAIARKIKGDGWKISGQGKKNPKKTHKKRK